MHVLPRIGQSASCKSTCRYMRIWQILMLHVRIYIKLLYYITIGPSSPKSLSITREFQDGIELNWLPPTEPNGEVHYVIYYTPEGGREETIDSGSNLTHYNLTRLERNSVYTNIAVQAVTSAGRSERSAVIAQNNYTPPGESCNFYIMLTLYFRSKMYYIHAYSKIQYFLTILCLVTTSTGPPSLPGPSSPTGNELLHACYMWTA